MTYGQVVVEQPMLDQPAPVQHPVFREKAVEALVEPITVIEGVQT